MTYTLVFVHRVKSSFRVLGGSRQEFPRWTPGSVKLLLPPRQSRGGLSLWARRPHPEAHLAASEIRIQERWNVAGNRSSVTDATSVRGPSVRNQRLRQYARGDRDWLFCASLSKSSIERRPCRPGAKFSPSSTTGNPRRGPGGNSALIENPM